MERDSVLAIALAATPPAQAQPPKNPSGLIVGQLTEGAGDQ